MTMHRMLMSCNEGTHKSKAQHDRKTGQIKTAKQHRKDVLESITHMISSQQNVDDVVLAADYNEDIESEEVEGFVIRNGLTDMFWHVRKDNMDARENTQRRGKKCIDSISVSEGLLPYIEGCEMTNYSEIIVTDHRGFVVDIDINAYLHIKISTFDEMDAVSLNPRRLSHKKKFVS